MSPRLTHISTKLRMPRLMFMLGKIGYLTYCKIASIVLVTRQRMPVGGGGIERSKRTKREPSKEMRAEVSGDAAWPKSRKRRTSFSTRRPVGSAHRNELLEDILLKKDLKAGPGSAARLFLGALLDHALDHRVEVLGDLGLRDDVRVVQIQAPLRNNPFKLVVHLTRRVGAGDAKRGNKVKRKAEGEVRAERGALPLTFFHAAVNCSAFVRTSGATVSTAAPNTADPMLRNHCIALPSAVPGASADAWGMGATF